MVPHRALHRVEVALSKMLQGKNEEVYYSPYEIATTALETLGIVVIGFTCRTFHTQGALHAERVCPSCFEVYRMRGAEPE